MKRGVLLVLGLLLAPSAGLCGDPPAAPADRVGSGWRVRGGVLESAVAGLRVKPPEGWDLLLGEEVEAEDPNADLGLVLRGTDLLVTVDAQESLGLAPEERLDEMLAVASLEKSRAPGDPVPARAGEASFPFAPWTAKDGGLAYWIGGFTVDGRAFCVTASCSAASREASAKRLPEAAAALEVIRGKARDTLATELLALPDGQAAWLGGVGFRRGTLRDFDHGIVWRLPRAFWSVLLRDPKEASDPSEQGMIATVTDRVLNVEGTLEVHPTGKKDLRAYQERMVAWFVDQVEGAAVPPAPPPPPAEKPAAEPAAAQGPPAAQGEEEEEEPATEVEEALEIDFAGGKGLLTRVHDAEGWQWVVVSTIRGETGTTVWFGGEEAAMEAAEGTLREALAGVRLDPAMRAEAEEKGAYRNDLFGFSLSLPGEGPWLSTVETEPSVFARSWSREGMSLHAEVALSPGGPELLTGEPDGSGRPVAAEFGGVPGFRIDRPEDHATSFVAFRDGFTYALTIAADAALPEERVEAIRAGFRLTE